MVLRAPSRPDRLFQALAEPIRLRILRMLQEGERCVCDIVADLDVPQPTASRHLAYLRQAGLVEATKRGYWSYYKLTNATDELHRRVLECIACCPCVSPSSRGGQRRECC